MMVSTTTMIRRLADALSRQRQADEHGIYCAVPRQAVDAAIRHLRAQADAQPVAWLYYSKHASQPFTTTCPPNTWGPNADDDRKTAVALYTHPAPAAPEIKERGPWTDRHTSVQAWIESDDFTHDVRLYVNGDFESNDQRIAYAQEIARRLNAASAAPQGDASRMSDALQSIRAHVEHDPSALAAAIVATCDSVLDAAPQAEPKREPLTDERIASVCLSYRHDFGLLSGDEQAGLMLEARAWERAFRKEWQR